MKLDWMILATAAEVHDGLVAMIGGGWDTIATTVSPPPGQPAAIIRGTLVIRLLLNRAETQRQHTFELRILDSDGGSVAQIEGAFAPDLNPNLPTGWDQNVVVAFELTGIPLPREGFYEIVLFVDGNFLGSRPFRVAPAPSAPPGFMPQLPVGS